MGMDIVQAFKTLCTTAPTPKTDRTSYSLTEDDDQNMVATAKRASTRVEHDDIEEQPDIDVHDPLKVQSALSTLPPTCP